MMKKLAVIASIVLGLIAQVVLADSPAPSGPITAAFDATAHKLIVSGTYTVTVGKGKEPGFAVFINGSTPDTLLPNQNVLDTSVQLLPQNLSAGSFIGSYTLTDKPTSVCVALYDVHLDSKGNPILSGDHSIISAGKNHNTDNSYDANKKSYPAVLCGIPIIPIQN